MQLEAATWVHSQLGNRDSCSLQPVLIFIYFFLSAQREDNQVQSVRNDQEANRRRRLRQEGQSSSGIQSKIPAHLFPCSLTWNRWKSPDLDICGKDRLALSSPWFMPLSQKALCVSLLWVWLWISACPTFPGSMNAADPILFWDQTFPKSADTYAYPMSVLLAVKSRVGAVTGLVRLCS